MKAEVIVIIRLGSNLSGYIRNYHDVIIISDNIKLELSNHSTNSNTVIVSSISDATPTVGIGP